MPALGIIAGSLVSLAGLTPAVAVDLVDDPEDQLAYTGENVTFEVGPRVGNLSYQWLRQSPDGIVELSGQTSVSLTLTNVQISDVGLYLCRVTHGNQIQDTAAASLILSTGSRGGSSSAQTFSLTSDGTDSITLFGPPVQSSGSQGTCPGPYAGYVNYRKTLADGWGWACSTNTTIHTASDATRTDTKVEYLGKLGDRGCSQTTVQTPDPPVSLKYRFTIYFPSELPATNAYPITLVGFNP